MTEPFVQEHDQLLQLKPWVADNKDLIAGFTTKNGGNSTGHFLSLNMGFHVPDLQEHVQKNRQMVAGILGVPLDSWVSSEQVHEASIKKITEEDKGKGARYLDTAIKSTDGLYTDQSNILLTSLYADCVPLYYRSKTKPFIGLAHAGWKGTVLGIGTKMLSIWEKEEQVPLDQIEVAIGPCISQNAYEVDTYVAERVAAQFGEEQLKEVTVQTRPGHYLLDLRKLHYLRFLDYGLKKEQIYQSSFCTHDEDSLFFSHRRDQGKTGRLMSFIGRVVCK
ncbi:peptidoglycan editing factor PgeF [Alkalihalobacillus pseudalcaliphilus]|uniref:peptidoglycan editing factor PgeF n=1 Tax=Alkalihalobacillus pseudalcaliphilus TaxID=79884 RepID=UPI00064DDBF6|nr:peptidoglycan editing factor PgeF [Alkalihalobacillus pseudalcaliphilus]KMK77130.1 hypothetical protein AB990_06150 [Alkalihalobacillus pseudalcaliphilus]